MSLLQRFGDELLAGRSTVPTVGVLQSAKYVALYFSAHWCGPCRNFTPILIQNYNYLRSQGIQVIFVSSDHNEAQFREYFATMPWKAVPFSRDRNALLQLFNVQGIPKLVILSQDGRVITTEGVEILKSDPSCQKLLSMLQPSRPQMPQFMPVHGMGQQIWPQRA
jgi:nucleoredoxin